MTPPPGTPKANLAPESSPVASDESTEAPETLVTARSGATKLRTGSGTGSGPVRRRPAALELRVARGRAGKAANGDDAGGATGGRGGGLGAGAGRFGGRGLRGGKPTQPDTAKAETVTEADLAEAGAVDATGATSLDNRQDMPAMGAASAAEAVVAAGAAALRAPAPPTLPVAPQADEGDADEADAPELPGPGRGRRRPGAAGGAGPKRSAGGAKAGKIDLSDYVVAPTVSPAGLRRRHYGVITLFVLMVILPTAAYSWYLWNRSADQYESQVGFGSRSEEAASTFDFLGALSGASTSSSKDMDILNQFIVSQELVDRIDKKLDLRAMYSKPQNDPLARFDPKGTIEDLVKFWQRMVVINYDSSTGLMNLQVFAFDPQDARMIARAVLDESTATINDLSMTAQVDTTRYSKQALQVAEDRLTKARVTLTDFRVKNHIVDPSTDIASQMSVMNTLNQQMAAAQIDLDLLAGTAGENDPRIAQLNRRIDVIGNRIIEERAKVGAVSDSTSSGYALLVSDYQRLSVDQDFAEKAYLSALAAYDQAILTAQQKTRYLATFVTPTLAEASTAPDRPLTAALTALIGFLAWAISVLIYYALRDRR